MAEERDNKKQIFSTPLALKENISRINSDIVEDWFINEFHKILDELQKIFTMELSRYRIENKEIISNIVDIYNEEGKSWGFGVKDINSTASTTTGTEEFQKKYCKKNQLLTKIDAVLYLFKKDIELAFQ